MFIFVSHVKDFRVVSAEHLFVNTKIETSQTKDIFMNMATAIISHVGPSQLKQCTHYLLLALLKQSYLLRHI